MVDPVMLVETGQTYDRTSIEGWFAKGKNTCPLSGRDLDAKQLVPNFAVKKMINEWIQSNCGSMTVHQVRVALRDGIAASEAISVGSIAPSAVPGGPEPWRPPSESDAIITPVTSIEHHLQGLALGGAGVPHHPAMFHDPGPASAPIYETASSTAQYADDGVDAGERAAAAAAIMQALTGPEIDPDTFREAASYHLWQLKELALDDQCREVCLRIHRFDVVLLLFKCQAADVCAMRYVDVLFLFLCTRTRVRQVGMCGMVALCTSSTLHYHYHFHYCFLAGAVVERCGSAAGAGISRLSRQRRSSQRCAVCQATCCGGAVCVSDLCCRPCD